MTYINDSRLRELRYKVYTIKDVYSALDELKEKLPGAEENVKYLSDRRDYEREDVESYEKGNLSSFIHGLFGKKEEHLEKERSEMYEAESNYNMAVYELNSIEINIARYESEIKELLALTEEYDRLIMDKREFLAISKVDMSEIFSFENEVIRLKERIEVLDNLAAAAQHTLDLAGELADFMNDAEYWAEECTRGGKNKATWTETDNRDNATYSAYTLAPKVKESVDDLNEKIIATELDDVIPVEFDPTVYDFKDPAWELFYGHNSLLWDIQVANEGTRKFRDSAQSIFETISKELEAKISEHEETKMKYEDLIINKQLVELHFS